MKMVIVTIIMSLTLMSGKVTLNHVPDVDKLTHSMNYMYQYESGELAIYLKSEMKGPDSYTDLIMLLNKHANDKRIKIYLSGNGGSVRGVMDLIHTVRSLPAETVIIVRGDVYSAHAMLAVSGDKLVLVNDEVLFLFHVPAVNGNRMDQACAKEKGYDRGIPRKLKCTQYSLALRKQLFNMVEGLLVSKIFTVEQSKQYYQGHDIILTGKRVRTQLEK